MECLDVAFLETFLLLSFVLTLDWVVSDVDSDVMWVCGHVTDEEENIFGSCRPGPVSYHDTFALDVTSRLALSVCSMFGCEEVTAVVTECVCWCTEELVLAVAVRSGLLLAV